MFVTLVKLAIVGNQKVHLVKELVHIYFIPLQSLLVDSNEKGPAVHSITLTGIEIFVETITTNVALCSKPNYMT